MLRERLSQSQTLSRINPNPDLDTALRLCAEDRSLDFTRFLFVSYKPHHWYWEVVDQLRRIFTTGFLVVLIRGSFAQIGVCLGVTVVALVALVALASRQPYLLLRDEDGAIDEVAPDYNVVASAMMWQTFALCNVLKGKEAEDWEDDTGTLDEGMMDGLFVASQFLGLLVLALKRWRNEAGQNLVAVLPVLEEGESLEAKVARLEREKEEERGWREAAEARERAATEELKKKN